MNNKKTYLVRARASGGFWTGESWSDEYPDSEIHQSKRSATKSAAIAFVSSQTGVEVIADYGLTTEEIVSEIVR